MNSKISNMVATMMVVILILLQFVPVISIAVEEVKLNSEVDSTNIENVKFDVYFADERKETEYDLSAEEGEITLFAKVKVNEAGYLDNIVIDFSSCNFELKLAEENEIVQSLEKNILKLNKISKDEEKVVALKVDKKEFDDLKLDSLYKTSLVKISGKYTNGEGKEEVLSSEKEIKLSYKAEVKSNLSAEISKYIPVLTVAGNKLMLQEKINSNIIDDKMPIGKTKIELEIPELEGKLPEEIRVVGESGATNGDSLGKEFGVNNYSYDMDKKIVTIEVKNKEILENQKTGEKIEKAYWTKGEMDEYLVTFIYDEEVLEKALNNKESVSVKVVSNIELLDEKHSIVENKVEGEIPLSEEIGSIVSGKVEAKDKINKGYMITNTKALEANKNETEYKTTYEVEIGYSDVVDRLNISLEEDSYIRGNIEEVKEGSTYIKEISINKEDFNKLLGEEGYIKLVSNDTEVYEINKDTTVNKAGDISIDVSALNTSKLLLITSNVKEEGKLRIDTKKAITVDSYYLEEEINQITKIKSREIVEAYNGEDKISEKEETTEAEVVGTELKASLSFDREKLTTVKTNERVKMTTMLETNSIDDKLFENPSIEVTMPKSFEKIENIEANVYFDDELAIANGDIIENEDGSKTIKINMQGMQTKYNKISTGTVVEIVSDITMNKLTPTKVEEIGLKVTNGTNEEIFAMLGEKIEAPEGIILSSVAKKDDGTVLIDSSENKLVAPLEKGVDSYNINFSQTLLNNTETNMIEPKIIINLPVEGTVNLKTTEPLENNISLDPVALEYSTEGSFDIATEGETRYFKIYSTENAEATEDLEVEANGWKLEDIQNAKKIMIVASEGVILKQGELITIDYILKTPDFIINNKIGRTQVAVYSRNIETIYSDVMSLESGDGAEFNLSLSANVEERSTIKPGEVVTFKCRVYNSSAIDGENMVLQLGIPTCMEYVEPNELNPSGFAINTEGISIIDGRLQRVGEGDEPNETTVFFKEIPIERIRAHESYEVEYRLRAKSIAERTQVRVYSFITLDNMPYYSNEYELYIDSTVLTKNVYTSLESAIFNNNAMVGDEFKLCYQIGTTDSVNQKNNTTIEVELPEELEYQGYEINKYDIEDNEELNVVESKNGNKYIFNIGKVNVATSVLSIKVKVKDFQGANKKKLSIPGRVYCDEDTTGLDVSINTVTINRMSLTITQTCDITENTKVKPGEDYSYRFVVNNDSNREVGNLIFEDIFPEGITFVGIDYQNSLGISDKFITVNDNNHPYFPLEIPANGSATIIVNVRAGGTSSDKTVINKGILYQNDKVLAQSNEIRVTIEKDETYSDGESSDSSTIDPSQRDDNPSDYNPGGDGEDDFEDDDAPRGNLRISGLLWEDSNKDGKRDSTEKLISDVTVVLLNKNNGKVVKNTRTDSNGQYTFSGLGQGSYSVVFLYDSSRYSSTIYRAKGVDSSLNSDAIDSKVSYQGSIRMAGVTEEIVLSNENAFSIDLGLTEYEAFDLSVEKRVKTISLTYQGKTTTYNYGTNFAKADVPAKEANGTTIVVTYEIIVRNEGRVAGTADVVRDNIPKDLTFSGELNKDWYESNGGVLNNSLAKTTIKPGETKTLTLVLTKRMNDNGYGLINNTAEIVKSSNEYGKEDIDSIPGNNNSEEDDLSNANVLISVKTGQWKAYTLLIVSIATIIIVTTILIRKKLMKGGNN